MRSALALAAIAAVALVALPLAAAADGDLDASFGDGGRVVTDLGGSEHLSALAVQANGRIVVAGLTLAPGGESDVALVRYLPDGSLDPSFGDGGRAVLDVSPSDAATDVALQRDRKLVVAGTVAGRPVLLRLLPGGRLDAAFGVGGIVDLPVRLRGVLVRVHVLPTGKILAAGWVGRSWLLARLSADGSLDPAFGRSGLVVTTRPIRDVAVTRAGRIVAVGTRFDPRKRATGDGFAAHLVVARYRADGSLDRTFSGDGVAALDLRRVNCCHAEAVAVRGDGRVLVAGYGERSGVAVTRLLATGVLDTSFGEGGHVSVEGAGAGAGGLVLDRRGRIVVATRLAPGGDFGVIRLTPLGARDATFGADGLVTTDFGAFEDSWALGVQSNGAIVVGGYTGARLLDASAPNDFALARYPASP